MCVCVCVVSVCVCVRCVQHAYTVDPGYNDIGLRDTSSNASDILYYQLIPHGLTTALQTLVVTTPVFNDKEVSVPYMML
jgi:hypothetical protein